MTTPLKCEKVGTKDCHAGLLDGGVWSVKITRLPRIPGDWGQEERTLRVCYHCLQGVLALSAGTEYAVSNPIMVEPPTWGRGAEG